MTNHQPLAIEPSEWKEIAALPLVREAWGLSDDETYEGLASQVYGAKFKFMSGSPGYAGDLFILHGDYLTNEPPLTLIRVNGELQSAFED